MFRLLFVACLSLFGLHAESLPKVDKVLVLKSKRQMQLLHKDKVVREYKIALGFQPVGKKTQEGDGKTPEGHYTINWRNAKSQFHKSLHISYPNAADKKAAKEKGVNPGGDIFIHGLGNGFGWLGSAHTAKDWTLGCIAVTNQEVDEVWNLVPNGTPIEIRG